MYLQIRTFLNMNIAIKKDRYLHINLWFNDGGPVMDLSEPFWSPRSPWRRSARTRKDRTRRPSSRLLLRESASRSCWGAPAFAPGCPRRSSLVPWWRRESLPCWISLSWWSSIPIRHPACPARPRVPIGRILWMVFLFPRWWHRPDWLSSSRLLSFFFSLRVSPEPRSSAGRRCSRRACRTRCHPPWGWESGRTWNWSEPL